MTLLLPWRREKPQPRGFDPDEFRMSIGDHLEELRHRLIKALIGFFIAVFGCMALGENIVKIFLHPLFVSQIHAGQNPQIFYTEVAESFMMYIKVSLICAAVVSGPWLVYQLWQFVAAGLFPNERRYITKYLPLSIALMIAGVMLLYFLVMPLMLTFFLEFNFGEPQYSEQIDPAAATQPATSGARILNGNPAHPIDGEWWFDRTQNRMKVYVGNQVRVIPLGTSGLATPLITLATYIDMFVGMLLSFALAFQMPLVVLALVRVGIVEVDQLKAIRRIVYFSMSIIAGFIVPDVVTGMVALLIPLILLFEMGLWLARDTTAASTPLPPGEG